MTAKLSIIIPCYNCQATLEEAVDSLFKQEPALPYGVTMIDDASTDGTYRLMKRLAAKYPRIRLGRHAINRGGGATRNTAVANSDGDVIFCLDSDDILGPNLLRNLTEFWVRKKCDGVGISKSVKFRGRNTSDIAYITDFEEPGRPVRFESLLDGSACSLTSTFLITRKAFARAGGYPTAHGFDTQGLAFRFLGNGLEAYTCPETLYYHRVEFGDSYYVREQRADRVNWNWFHVLDEFIYLFKPQVRRQLLESDLFAVPGRPAPKPILDILRPPGSIYARGYQGLIRLGRQGVAKRFGDRDDGFWHYWMGGFEEQAGDLRAALNHYIRAAELGFGFKIVFWRILGISLRLGGKGSASDAALEDLLLYSRPFPANQRPLGDRLFGFLTRLETLRAPALLGKAAYQRLHRKNRS